MGNNSTGSQGSLDLGHALLGTGLEAEDALAVLCKVGAQSEAEAAAGTGVLHRSNGLSANLTGQIDLNQGVDGNHVILTSNVMGIQNLGAGLHDALGVVVQILIQLMGAVGKYTNMHALIVGLTSTGDNAGINKVSHGGGELLGVQAQIVLVHQVLANGIGDTANAHLDGVAILDQRSDHFADLVLFGGGGNRSDAVLGGVDFIQQGNCLYRNIRGAIHIGQVGVDLNDDLLVLLNGVLDGIVLDGLVHANIELAVLSHGRNLSGEDVAGLMTVDHAVVVGQVNGNEAGIQQLVSLTVGRAIEVVVAVDVAVHAGGHHEGITTNAALVDDNVVNTVSDLMEMAKQGFGLVVVVGAPDYVTGVNHIQSVLHGAFFGFVDFFVIFASHSANLFPGGFP